MALWLYVAGGKTPGLLQNGRGSNRGVEATVIGGVTSIALSGLGAQVRAVEASASNVANLHTRGAVPDAAGAVPAGQPRAYQPVRAVGISQVLAGGEGAGVRTELRSLSSPLVLVSDPNAEYANQEGLVAAPDVDPAGEAATRLSAVAAYRANLIVLKTTDELAREVLDAKV